MSAAFLCPAAGVVAAVYDRRLRSQASSRSSAAIGRRYRNTGLRRLGDAKEVGLRQSHLGRLPAAPGTQGVWSAGQSSTPRLAATILSKLLSIWRSLFPAAATESRRGLESAAAHNHEAEGGDASQRCVAGWLRDRGDADRHARASEGGHRFAVRTDELKKAILS